MWSCQWPFGGNPANVPGKLTCIIFFLHLSRLLIGGVSAVSVRVTESTSLSTALSMSSVTEVIIAPDRHTLGRRVLVLQGRFWPGQVANTIDGGRYLVIRSGFNYFGCTDLGDPVEIDFNRIPWIIEVGANSTLEFQNLSLTNLATISKSGNGAFPQYLYVGNSILWPSITSKPGAVISMVNTSMNFWSKTLFKNPDCRYMNLPARPASEQVTVLRGSQNISTLPSGVVQLVDDDVVMQLPVLSLDNNTRVGAMTFVAKRCVANCTPSLRSGPGISPGHAEAPDQALPPPPRPLAAPPADPGKSILAIVLSTVAAVAATVTAAGVVALVLVLRGRRRGSNDKEAAKPRFPDGKQMSRRLNARGSFMSLESHLFRQSRMRRLGPLGNEEVEIGPVIGKGSFGRVHKGRWRNTLVAIKMVEHSVEIVSGLGVGKKSLQDSLQLETLLSLSLCHPNIVATFKVCTVEVGGVGSSSSAVSNAEAPAGWHSPALPGVPKQPAQKLPAQISQYRTPAAVQDEALGAAGMAGPGGLAGAAMQEEPVPQRQCDGAASAGAQSSPGAGALLVQQRLPEGADSKPALPPVMASASSNASASQPIGREPLPQRVEKKGEGDRSSTEQSPGQAIKAGTGVPSGGPSNVQVDTENGLQGAAGVPGSSELAGHSEGHVGEKGASEASRGQGLGASTACGSSSSRSIGQRGSWGICYACVTLPATDEAQLNCAAANKTAHAKEELGDERRSDTAWGDGGEVRTEHMETWMLMEYCERGSLEHMIRAGRFRLTNGHPNLPMIIACLLDIASGVAYLHAANVLHCDLKPANVLLKATSANKRGFVCKLADFGMSRLLDITHRTHLSTQTYGTMSYMPPEMLIESRLTQQTDVYSFGIIMWELFSAQAVHANMTSCQVFFAVVNERQRPTLEAFDRALSEMPGDKHIMMMYLHLMQRCWADEPAQRPPFTAILTELAELKALSNKVAV